MERSDLRAGLRAGAVAGALSGLPSSVQAVATGRSPFDALQAAGTLLLADDAPSSAHAAAGVVAHGAISLGWGVVLAPTAPHRHNARLNRGHRPSAPTVHRPQKHHWRTTPTRSG